VGEETMSRRWRRSWMWGPPPLKPLSDRTGPTPIGPVTRPLPLSQAKRKWTTYCLPLFTVSGTLPACA
jgi:hypothetical protein